MDKKTLLENIQTKHRQLERYLFYFERDLQGGFAATDRPKFGLREMEEPGVYQGWSVIDLLVYIISWEGRFISWYCAGLEDRDPEVHLEDLLRENTPPAGFDPPSPLQDFTMMQLLGEFKRSFHETLQLIESIPAAALPRAGYYDWAGEVPISAVVAHCTFERYDWAKRLISRWRKRHPGLYMNKVSLLERIQTERRRLELNLEQLSETDMMKSGVVGEWNVKDLLAHLAEWEQRFIGWYRAGIQGDTPEIPAPGMGWKDLDTVNQQIYDRHSHRALEEVRRDFKLSFEHISEIVEGIGEEDLFSPGRYAWLGESSLSDFVLANTANHYRWAKEQIRRWQRTAKTKSESTTDANDG